MIVVDANVLAYLFVQGAHTSAAEYLLATGQTWVAPILWRSELRSTLTGYLRRDVLKMHEVRRIQATAEELLRGNEYELDSSTIFDLVGACDCSAYDCEYVALAMHLGTKLVTMDAKILRAFPTVAVPLSSD